GRDTARRLASAYRDAGRHARTRPRLVPAQRSRALDAVRAARAAVRAAACARHLPPGLADGPGALRCESPARPGHRVADAGPGGTLLPLGGASGGAGRGGRAARTAAVRRDRDRRGSVRVRGAPPLPRGAVPLALSRRAPLLGGDGLARVVAHPPGGRCDHAPAPVPSALPAW